MVRSVASWLCWLALLTGLWLLYVGAFDRVDVVAGILAAAVGATAAEVVRRQGLLRFRIEPGWVASAWRVPYLILWEFVLVTAALVRRPRSAFKTVPFDASGDDPTAAGRRAWSPWVLTLSPNDFVVDVDRGSRHALMHALVLERSSDRLP